MKKEWYSINLIKNPRQTLEKLEKDPLKIRKSFCAILIMAILYSVAVYLISLNNLTSDLKPFLNIPEEKYYFFQTFIMVPVILSGWLLVSGIIFLVSKTLKGTGNYEDILAFTGYCIAVPTYITLIADVVTSLLGYFNVMSATWWASQIATFGTAPFFFLWTIILAEIIWIIYLFTISIQKIQVFNRRKSTAIAILCFTLYQGFLLIFIR